jgi:hypothetical protein
MVKIEVLGCNFKKDCEADEGITERPFTCCAYCTIKGGCPNESEQCSEVPDTCSGIIAGQRISDEEAQRRLK